MDLQSMVDNRIYSAEYYFGTNNNRLILVPSQEELERVRGLLFLNGYSDAWFRVLVPGEEYVHINGRRKPFVPTDIANKYSATKIANMYLIKFLEPV